MDRRERHERIVAEGWAKAKEDGIIKTPKCNKSEVKPAKDGESAMISTAADSGRRANISDLTSLLRRPIPCIYLGKRTRRCAVYPQVGNTYECKKLKVKCGRSRFATGIKVCCDDCNDYVSSQTWPIRYDETNLWIGTPGKRFNSSIMRSDDFESPTGHYLFAFRNGWAGSDIYVGKLDKAFRPMGRCVRLELNHRRAHYGREDPRLFRFRGQIHVSYIGCVGHTNPLRTHQLYARLNDRLQVEQEFSPRLRVRQHWEKNWAFFEHDEQLYCVYSIAPHKIIRIDGDATEVVAETNTPLQWSGGELRGGAAPIRVGDEYYCFFHGKIGTPQYSIYNTGVYTFEAKPPFRITRMTPNPIDVANIENKPADQWCPVLFCCGAVPVDNHWVTANGIHDRWTEIRRYFAVDQQLQPVTT